LTEDWKEGVRAKVRADNEKLNEGLAFFYLGRVCPISQKECLGMGCPWFLVSQEIEGNKRVISGGNCSIPLLASQAGPIAEGLIQSAPGRAGAPGAPGTGLDLPKIIPPTGVVVR
jgi:hypothetical protein